MEDMEDNTRVVKDNKSRKSSIFSFYDRLAKSNNKKKSCAALIDFLQNSNNDVGSTTATLYTAKRLVRGLSAPDVEKRNVFFSTLCTVLSMDIVTPDQVVESLKNAAENSGSTKSERASILLTTVLSHGALISTGKINDMAADEHSNILEKLMAVSNSKATPKTAASAFLVAAVNTSTKAIFKTVFIPPLQNILSATKEYEDDFIAFLAVAYLKQSKSLQSLIEKFFDGRTKFLDDVVLRGSYFAPHLQEQIVKSICVDLSLSGKGKTITALWTKVIEKDQKPHPTWDAYILLFARIILDVMPEANELNLCLHPKLFNLIVKHLQVPYKKANDNAIFSRAKDVLDKLVARVGNEAKKEKIALKVTNKILFLPGGLLFDKKTRTNTIQSLISFMGDEELQRLANDFVSKIKQSQENNEKGLHKDIPLMIAMLIKILSTSHFKKSEQLLTSYLTFIFDVAFVKSSLNSDVRAKVRDSFYRAAELNNVKLEEIVAVLTHVVNHADGSMQNMIAKLSESSLVQWKSMLATVKKMEAKSSTRKYMAIRALLLHMGLMIFRDEDLASSAIEELLQCYQRVKSKKSKKVQEMTDSLTAEPHWVEVTVDLLLAMLSRENKLLRQVVSSVFPSIVPELTATALQQIVDGLDPSFRNDVLHHVDSDESGEEEEDADAEAASDEDNDFDDEDEEDEDEDIDDEEETVNDKLRMAVRSALGYSAALTDDEDADMDEMNEEEEKRLNESLSNAFRLFKPSKGSKKKQSKEDEAIMHFRIRILDLIEIIILNSPSISSCIELLDPLLGLLEFAIRDSHQKPLQNRLESVVKKLGSVKKFSESNATCLDIALALKKLFEIDTSGLVSVEMAPTITECCIMLVRAAQLLHDDNDNERIEKLFVLLLDRHFLQNDRKIPYAIFQQALRLLWDGNWSLSKSIMNLLLNVDLKIYKKIKLLELLEIFYLNDRLQSTATDDCKKAASLFETNFVIKFDEMLTSHYCRKATKLSPAFYDRIVSFVQLAMQSRDKYRENCRPVPSWQTVIGHLLENLQLFQQQKTRNKLFLIAQRCNLSVPSKAELKELKKNLKKSRAVSESDEEAEEPAASAVSPTVSESDEQDEEPPAKRKNVEKTKANKKSSKETHKLKKESQKRRNLASSEGLEGITFTGVDTLKIEDEEVAEPAVKKWKRSGKKSKVN